VFFFFLKSLSKIAELNDINRYFLENHWRNTRVILCPRLRDNEFYLRNVMMVLLRKVVTWPLSIRFENSNSIREFPSKITSIEYLLHSIRRTLISESFPQRWSFLISHISDHNLQSPRTPTKTVRCSCIAIPTFVYVFLATPTTSPNPTPPLQSPHHKPLTCVNIVHKHKKTTVISARMFLDPNFLHFD